MDTILGGVGDDGVAPFGKEHFTMIKAGLKDKGIDLEKLTVSDNHRLHE